MSRRVAVLAAAAALLTGGASVACGAGDDQAAAGTDPTGLQVTWGGTAWQPSCDYDPSTGTV